MNLKKAEKQSCKFNYNSTTIFDENLIAVNMNKKSIYFNKPVYVGQAVLDLSKDFMYQFHYDYMKNRYDDRVKLLYTETDSFVYEIKTDYFYKDIESDVKDFFDTSNIDNDHISGIGGWNKKVPGMMKDECGGKIMRSFIGLRAKLYSFKMDEGDEVEVKCKGLKKCVP